MMAANEKRLRFRFRLATADDDAAIRDVLRDTPMDGPVQVTLRRDPCYFAAAAVEGRHRQTLVVTDGQSDRIVGTGERSVRDRYVDGQPLPIGYLSGLRILSPYRGGSLLARGYRELRRMHGDGATACYLTTIADGNHRAMQSLGSRRAGLPRYDRLGEYSTFVVPLRRNFARSVRPLPDGLKIRRMSPHELPQLVEFLNRCGSRRLFFPRYTLEDFGSAESTFRDLLPDQIITAWRDERIEACLGLWDQRQFKQTIVEGYRFWLRMLRPAFNGLAKCLGWPRFPAARQPFRAMMGAFPLVADDNPDVFRHLLRWAQVEASRADAAVDGLLIGAFERDPLFHVIRRAALFRYVTHVFLVYWDEPTVRPDQIRDRDLYLELGCL